MPSWAFNKVLVTGLKSDVDAAINGILNADGEIDFNEVIPMPAHQPDLLAPKPFWAKGDLPLVLVNRFGRNNWYDWSVDNWGTKWNASDMAISDNLVEFDTAWSGVPKVILEWSKKFPAVNMEYDVSYEAENVVDHYVIRAGEEISFWEEELECEEEEVEVGVMTIERWGELNDHLLSISVGGEEIGEDNGCYRVDDGAYVREGEYKEAFEDEREQEAWATICNLQTVDGLSLQDAIEKVNGLSREDLKKMVKELAVDEDVCVYHTEGWND